MSACHLLALETEDTLAISLYERACDGGYSSSCLTLARWHTQGHVVPRDITRAASLYWRACDLGHYQACLGGAEIHGHSAALDDSTREAAFMQKACDIPSGEICMRLGLMYDIGLRVPKDTARANELLKKACAVGHEEACGMVRR
jgi:TPR repeat protein